jgi:hypothetical protein
MYCPDRTVDKESKAKVQIAKGNILEASHFQQIEEEELL